MPSSEELNVKLHHADLGHFVRISDIHRELGGKRMTCHKAISTIQMHIDSYLDATHTPNPENWKNLYRPRLIHVILNPHQRLAIALLQYLEVDENVADSSDED